MLAGRWNVAVAVLLFACGARESERGAVPGPTGGSGASGSGAGTSGTSGAAGASGGSSGGSAGAGMASTGGGAGTSGSSAGGIGTAGDAGSGAAAGSAASGGGATAGGSSGSGGGSGTSGDAGAPSVGGTPTYESLTVLPTPRQEHGVAALDGEVWVVGGYTPDLTASVQVYSPEGEQWREAPDFPSVLHHPNVAGVDGKLYVTGFHIAGGRRIAAGQSFVLDPVAGEWTEIASLPAGTERGASCVTTIGSVIYVFGGTNDLTLPYASAYDTIAKSWEPLPDVPGLRQHCMAAAVGGKIYIVSGRNMGIEGVEAGSFVYDPVEKTYEERAPILTPRGGAAGGALGTRIFVFGGEGNPDDPMGIFHEAEAYDTVADSWETLPDLPVARHGFGGAVVGNRIYLPGGSTSQGVDTSDENTVFYLMP